MNRQAGPGKQRGVSLIEIVVGLAIGFFILAGTVTVYIDSVRSTSDNLRMTHLDQQLRTAVSVMAKDLRRAGAVAAIDEATGAVDNDLLVLNPFSTITLAGNCSGGVCDCILYSYDLDKDGLVDLGSGGCGGTCAAGFDDNGEQERFGFRLDNGAIQMRTGGSTYSCTQDSWTAITDDALEVTGLRFELDPAETALVEVADMDGNAGVCGSGDACLERRQINIEIDGRLTSDAAVGQSIRQEVKVRNDRFYCDYPSNSASLCP